MPYLLRRLLGLVLTLLLVSLITFAVVHVLPGDPAMLILGHEASPESLAGLRAALGLDRPLPAQYLSWLAGALHGDLGMSLRHNLPVGQLIAERLPVTASLAALATLLAVGLALPLGMLAAVRQGTAVDLGVLVLSQVGVALPAFWIGILLIVTLAVGRHLFPTGGYVPWSASVPGALRSLALPAVALSLPMVAVLVRLVRNAMLDELGRDHIRTARAKGLPERTVLLRHALRGALIPTVTMVGLQLGFLLGGSIVIEQVFSLPGLGRLVLSAIANRDVPLIQGLVVFIATLAVAINFTVDVLYAALDPRLSLWK
ncbi:MAG TPA: ABC transporter permease [Anaerolineae bacterium]|nr:ABC transporter permease [Anaerolineae bacterium]